MTAAPATVRLAPPVADATRLYRDDGPLASALGRALGPYLRVPPTLLVVAGVVPLGAAVALAGDDAPLGVVAIVLAWLLVSVGASSGRRGHARSRWLEPPLVRLAEYGGIIWLAAIAGPDTLPAAFALLAALAFRHYDIVYGLRHRAGPPARWVSVLSWGWEGRLAFAFAVLALNVLATGFGIAAAVLGAAFVAETLRGWRIAGQDAGWPGDDRDDEEGGE